MRRFLLFASVALVMAAGGVAAQAPTVAPPGAPARHHALPPLRVQADEQLAWTRARLERVLPRLMAEYDVPMWILSMREYAEDPVFFSMAAPTTFAARRRSIYVFTLQPDGTVERLALGGGTQGGLFQAFRSARPAPTEATGELWGDEQWRLLRELVEDRDPAAIVLNIDEHHAFSDGLHAGEREALERALGPYAARVKRDPRLAQDYVAVRVPEMLPRYRQIQETVHAILSEAFSNAVVQPGTTTTEDVQWWLRERIQALGMTTWFHPSVDVQRAAELPPGGATVILPGDVLWVDFGVVAMGLHTDTQHMGYVLRQGETAPPEGVRACLATSNRLQDLVVAEMAPGRSGNAILAAALERMRAEGIDGTVYGHPVGDHGHGAGPLIGRWDGQEGVPHRGDVLLRPDTWHSVELQATVPVPEWGGKPLACRQEEEVLVDADGKRTWGFRRQEAFHLVWPRQPTPSVAAGHTAVDSVLTALHMAAAEGDWERYFGLYAPDAVFFGTDATERWDLETFRTYAGESRGWKYDMVERNLFLDASGNTAWFDERLTNASYGETRGTGVLIRSPEGWKVAQYNLTIPIPNELAREFTQRIRALGGGE